MAIYDPLVRALDDAGMRYGVVAGLAVEERTDDWTASWDDERRRRLEGTLRATPAERLDWLEEALEIAYRAGALDRKPDDEERAERDPADSGGGR